MLYVVILINFVQSLQLHQYLKLNLSSLGVMKTRHVLSHVLHSLWHNQKVLLILISLAVFIAGLNSFVTVLWCVFAIIIVMWIALTLSPTILTYFTMLVNIGIAITILPRFGYIPINRGLVLLQIYLLSQIEIKIHESKSEIQCLKSRYHIMKSKHIHFSLKFFPQSIRSLMIVYILTSSCFTLVVIVENGNLIDHIIVVLSSLCSIYQSLDILIAYKLCAKDTWYQYTLIRYLTVYGLMFLSGNYYSVYFALTVTNVDSHIISVLFFAIFLIILITYRTRVHSYFKH